MPPTRTRIKICGICQPDAARAAVDAGADAIGLVFAAGTPRAVTPREAEAVLRVLPPYVEPVAMFVDAPASLILDTCRQLGVRTVQVHGREQPAAAVAVAPLRVVKAIAFDAQAADRLAGWDAQLVPNLAAILWDAPPPAETRNPAQTGGHGRVLDWTALAAFLDKGAADGLAAVLAGGLTPANVADAIARVRPYAVDVSSGVESSRGVKDPALIAAFCRAVRAADA